MLQSGDYSITVSDERDDVIKSLKDLDVKFDAKLSKERLKTKLSNLLKKNHPIHKHVEELSLASARQLLNALTNSVKKLQKRDTKKAIINECFKNAASGPLTYLCKLESTILVQDDVGSCIETPAMQALLQNLKKRQRSRSPPQPTSKRSNLER